MAESGLTYTGCCGRIEEITAEQKRYMHTPGKSSENNKATTFWDMSMQSKMQNKTNHPDAVLKEHKKKKCS